MLGERLRSPVAFSRSVNLSMVPPTRLTGVAEFPNFEKGNSEMSKSNITPFNYNGHNLSTITDEHGEIWFIAKEVAEILEYSDAGKMCERLEDDEKQNRQIRGFGNRGVITINESGLYSAILGSTKPEAKPFKKWVTSEVLPSIRKTGSYTAPAATNRQAPPAKLFPDYFKVAKLIGCDRNAAAISANQAVFKKTGENVLALLGHEYMESEKQELVFNVSDLVDGISGQRMNKMLEAAGLQHNEKGRWIPDDDGKFSRIFDTGKRHGDGTPVQTVKWSRDVLAMLSVETAA